MFTPASSLTPFASMHTLHKSNAQKKVAVKNAFSTFETATLPKIQHWICSEQLPALGLYKASVVPMIKKRYFYR
ncbi:MAG: hypothetical protein ABUL58_07080 [Steroidobacter sp.]